MTTLDVQYPVNSITMFASTNDPNTMADVVANKTDEPGPVLFQKVDTTSTAGIYFINKPAGNTTAIGSTVGANAVAITAATMPAHRHSIPASSGNGNSYDYFARSNGGYNLSRGTLAAGSGQTHENRPLSRYYLAWRRVS